MSDGSPLPNRTAETPVSGRNYPDDDPSGRRWSEIWRAAVEELNANALVSDLATNRLDYTPEDGTLFVPTDGGDWFIGDGSSWNNLGAIGDVDNHLADTSNPHDVTAAQADALPTSGGTVTGDTTFTNTTHDSIDADELNNAWKYPAPADDGAGIQSAIDELDAAGGGVVALQAGTYVVNSPPLVIKDNIHVIGAGRGATTVQLAGGLDSNAKSVFEFQGSHASIRSLEVDGNKDNNTYSTHPDTPNAQGVRVANGAGIALSNITLSDLYIHDTIRSSVTADADYCYFEDLWCENADTDHWLYLSAGEGLVARNIDCTGGCRNVGIIIGSNVRDSTVENVVIHDVALTSNSREPISAVHFRQTNLSSTNNTLRNVRINNEGSTVTTGRVLLGQPNAHIENYHFRGYYDRSYFFHDDNGVAEGTTISGCDIHVTGLGSNTGFASTARINSDNFTIENLRMTEPSGNSNARGVTVVDDSDGVANIAVRDAYFDIGQAWLRGSGSGGGVTKLRFSDLQRERDNGVSNGGLVAYTIDGVGEESGTTTEPTASYWHSGAIIDYTDTDDGAGTGTWLLLPDGTTWRQLA